MSRHDDTPSSSQTDTDTGTDTSDLLLSELANVPLNPSPNFNTRLVQVAKLTFPELTPSQEAFLHDALDDGKSLEAALRMLHDTDTSGWQLPELINIPPNFSKDPITRQVEMVKLKFPGLTTSQEKLIRDALKDGKPVDEVVRMLQPPKKSQPSEGHDIK